jgi:O-antigen/teichoic acid export membrane protein
VGSIAAKLMGSRRLRTWGMKSAWSLVDQGLAALTGFSVTFLLARWLTAEIYGAYAIAFAGYLFVSGLHNVVVLEPMSVLGPSRHATRLGEYFRAQMIVHGVLTGACAAVVVLAGLLTWFVTPTGPLVGAILGSGSALPFLLFLFLARRMCYAMQRPVLAILGSGSCFTLTVLGLFVLRHFAKVSPFAVFLLIGASSLVGSCLVMREMGFARESASGARQIDWRSTLTEDWRYGRWLVGSTILYSVSGQVQMFLAAVILGLGGAGILRAMMLPASVMTQAVTAAGLLVLPGFSQDFGRGLTTRIQQKAVIVSTVLCAGGLFFAAVLWFADDRVERLLFSGKYGAFAWLMPILALIPVANGFTMGYSAALRASQRPQLDLLANGIAALVAVCSAVLFIRWWGLAGAAISMLSGFVVYAAANCWAFYVLLRPEVSLRVAPDGAAE